MKRHILALMAYGVATAAGAGAVAAAGVQQDNVRVRTVTVPYDAAEVRNAEGAEKLFFRIRQAAEEACDLSPNEVGAERWDEHACETEAVSDAVRDVGEPQLTRIYTDMRGSATPGQEDRR